MLKTSSSLREANYTLGKAVARSPEELPDSEGRKGNSVTEQRCRELVNITKYQENNYSLCGEAIEGSWRPTACRKSISAHFPQDKVTDER